MIVTLTTDFGDSAYAGAIRGAILRANPKARVVDVTHAVPPQDVRAGALALLSAAPCFPEGSVHCAVVDPGVGGPRRALAMRCRAGILVGPDNGLLAPAAHALGLERVVALDDPSWWRAEVSATFHGRDVFGPVAGRLSAGGRVEEAGSAIEEWVDLDFGEPEARDGGLVATVLYVDPFGNAVTNVRAQTARERFGLGRDVSVTVSHRQLRVRLARTYAEVNPREAVLLVGSSGFLELSVNRGNAAEVFGVRAGGEVLLSS